MEHEREDYNKRVICTDGSIPDDEPVFLLRGKDGTAFGAIMKWIELNKNYSDDKLVSVLRHAKKMRAYWMDQNDTCHS